jgi:hypothetical protein
LTGLNESVLQIKTKTVSSHTADSKPVEQEVNSTVILPPLVFHGQAFYQCATDTGKLDGLNLYQKYEKYLNQFWLNNTTFLTQVL